MIYTPKLNLKKPESTDYISPSPFNDNADILDNAMLTSVYDPNNDGIVNEAIKATLDGNGDDISSSYLSLSNSGAQKVMGNLNLDTTSVNELRHFYMFKNGVLEFSITDDIGVTDISAIKHGDVIASSGILLDKNTVSGVTLYGNGGEIKFHPNGSYDTTGEVRIDSSGIIHGGSEIKYQGADGVSVPAATLTQIQTYSVPAGKWIIISYMRGNTSGTGELRNYLQSTTLGVNRRVTSPIFDGGSSVNVVGANISSSETFTIQAYSTVATSIHSEFQAIRVG